MVSVIASYGKSGLHDWILQRITAVIILFYVITFAVLFKYNFVSYELWKSLFNILLFKIFTLLFMMSLIIHCWIGFWIIFTDYVKFVFLRFIIQVCFIIVFLLFFFITIEILWGI